MANYVDSTVFINGSKRAIVDFLNKGLKNNKQSLRVSCRMSGEHIAALLSDLDRAQCLATFSFLPHPKTFDHWDTTNKILYFEGWCKRNGATEATDPVEAYRKYVRGYRRAVAYQQKKYGVVGWYEWNSKHYGCKWAAFERWKCLKDADGSLCLSSEVESPWAPPITFFEYMNNLDGITIYAYGMEACYWGYMWNGRTLEDAEINPDKDSRYEQMLQEYADEKGVDLNSYEAQHGCIPGFYPEEVYGRILTEYLDKYKAEINSELGLS